jgi:hypothetical protein
MASSDTERKGKHFVLKPSDARQQWDRLKSMGASNEHVDELMDLVGLEEVKQQFLSLWAKVNVYGRQNINHEEERYHIVLLGNPGTGIIKTQQRLAPESTQKD